MVKNNKQAFTLVELIVVITILAILGTIAFISLQGYSASARDSKRISDIQNIKKSLELFSINTGKYPLPDNPNEAIFSGSTIWTQGIVGDNMTTNLSRNLKIKPTDPLTETEYIYSATNSQTEYEILAIYESDIISYNILNQTNAASQDYPKIDGTYNGVAVKTPKYIIPTPSIINAGIETGNVELDNTTIQSQITTGGDNVLNTGGTEITETGNLDITFSVYEIPSNGVIDKIEIATIIQDTYNGSTYLNNGIYAKINNSDISELVSLINNTVFSATIYSQTGNNSSMPICQEGYYYDNNTNKCQNNPTCTTGYIYNSTTKLCQKIETISATGVTPTQCSGRFTGSNRWGLLLGNNLTCNAAPNGRCTYYSSQRFSIRFNSSCVVVQWSRDLNIRYKTVGIGSSAVYNSSYEHIERVYNTTVPSYSCPDGYTLSGSNCNRTLTEIPTCLNSGTLNTIINLCELKAICDSGVLNTYLDACINN